MWQPCGHSHRPDDGGFSALTLGFFDVASVSSTVPCVLRCFSALTLGFFDVAGHVALNDRALSVSVP